MRANVYTLVKLSDKTFNRLKIVSFSKQIVPGRTDIYTTQIPTQGARVVTPASDKTDLKTPLLRRQRRHFITTMRMLYAEGLHTDHRSRALTWRKLLLYRPVSESASDLGSWT